MNRVAIMGMKLSGMNTMSSWNWNSCDPSFDTLLDMSMNQWLEEWTQPDKVNLRNTLIIWNL